MTAGIFAATRVGMEFGSFRLRDGRVTTVDGALEGVLASPVTFPESETPL